MKLKRRNLSKRIVRHLWWLDVIYPLALGLLIVAALSYTVYSGPRQSRLSLKMEKDLIRFSLDKASGQAIKNPRQVLVVSVGGADLPVGLGASDALYFSKVMDLYEGMLETLSQQGMPLIFVHWDLEIRSGDELAYDHLAQTLESISERTKVFFVTSTNKLGQVPLNVLNRSTWLNDSYCDEQSEVQIDCSLVPDYGDWVVQQILNSVRPDLAPDAMSAPWVSERLANGFPSYLLNLNPPQTMATRSAREILQSPGLASGYRVAFIGNDIKNTGPIDLRQEAAHKVKTIYNRGDSGDSVGGIAPHVFWALLAQMFVDGSMISMPSDFLMIFYNVLICSLLFTTMVSGDGPIGLVCLLAYMFIAPLLNAAGMRFWRFYMPLFDSYYFGLFAIIVAGLGRLSWVTVQRWRLESKRRFNAQVADLKANFISLLSHNLNTPVAKMQGMLEVLRKLTANTSAEHATRQSEALVTQLEFAIRSVLIASALEEGALNETARRPDDIMAEIAAATNSSVRRLGIALSIMPLVCEDEGALYLPLTFDMRALTAAVSGLVALFYQQGRRTSVELNMSLRQDDAEGDSHSGSQFMVCIDLMSQQCFIPLVAERLLLAREKQQMRAVGGDQFFAEVLAAFVHLFVGTYDGAVELTHIGDGGKIRITFKPRSKRETSGGSSAAQNMAQNLR